MVESSGTNNISVLTEKVEQILEKVESINSKLDKHSEKLGEVDVKIALLENKIQAEEKGLSDIKAENNKLKWQVIGVGAAIVSGLFVAIIKSFMGI